MDMFENTSSFAELRQKVLKTALSKKLEADSTKKVNMDISEVVKLLRENPEAD